MEATPYSNISKGSFLIAAPEIESGIFFRAVVLVCEHSPNGSFGLVINKNLDLELPGEILDQRLIQNPRVSVRAGGPVQTNQMMMLHSSDSIPQQTLEICPGVYLGGDLEFLQQHIVEEDGPSIRLCFGYAGWGAGQLEREFLDGGWFLYPGSRDYVFHENADNIWKELLREMGGKYASLSMIPDDLSLN